MTMKTKTKTKTATVKKTHPLSGKNVHVRTVTHFFTGRVVSVDESEITLDRAAWIASDGRFAQALATGHLEEVEPYPEHVLVYVSRGAVIDWCEWGHDLPREQL